MWILPISMLVITTLLAIPLSRYMTRIMDGKYRVPRILGWFEAAPQQRTTELEAIHGFPAYLQYRALCFRLYRSGAPAVDASQPATQGDACADGNLSHRCFLHDQHGRSALFRRRALLQFHADILCLYDVFSFGVDWLLCPYDDHSGPAQRFFRR